MTAEISCKLTISNEKEYYYPLTKDITLTYPDYFKDKLPNL